MTGLRKTLLVLLLALSLPAAAVAAAAETIAVVVKKASVRRDPRFTAPAVVELPFQEKLRVVSRKDGWVQVEARGLTGWVHGSAVAVRAVSVSAQAASAGVSADDVGLAGKGFNKSVEEEYRKGAARANFGAVDALERQAVSEKTLAAFRAAGRLQLREELP
jgi:uncharacterized protein YraI